MARIVLDSNVVIYISQDKLELKNLPSKYDEILISQSIYKFILKNIEYE